MHFEPYKDEKYLNKTSSTSGVQKDEGVALKFKGPEIWTLDGRKEEPQVLA